jgi:hypothetical protein
VVVFEGRDNGLQKVAREVDVFYDDKISIVSIALNQNKTIRLHQ